MINNNSPTVSVCIPTYKGGKHLCTAIESVLQQDFTDFELIIIDDNSPDNTADLVAAYTDQRIRYIKNAQNVGPEGNWNKCLTEAKGKYFKLLPHDDRLEVSCLSRQIEILEQDKKQEISLVFCARTIIGSDDNIITTRRCTGNTTGIIPADQITRKSIRMGTNLIGEPGAVLFRKETANQVGKFDGSIGYIIDLDYWLRLLLTGNAYYIDEALSSFRVAHGSWSIDIGSNQSNEFIEFIERCKNQPAYHLTTIDIQMGKLMAKANNYLRLLFYKLYLK